MQRWVGAVNGTCKKRCGTLAGSSGEALPATGLRAGEDTVTRTQKEKERYAKDCPPGTMATEKHRRGQGLGQ